MAAHSFFSTARKLPPQTSNARRFDEATPSEKLMSCLVSVGSWTPNQPASMERRAGTEASEGDFFFMYRYKVNIIARAAKFRGHQAKAVLLLLRMHAACARAERVAGPRRWSCATSRTSTTGWTAPARTRASRPRDGTRACMLTPPSPASPSSRCAAFAPGRLRGPVARLERGSSDRCSSSRSV